MERSYDTLFEELLSQLKPLVLKLHQREDRQRVALWIKKLNESNCSDTSWKKTRYRYIQLLKMMLEKGEFEDPFKGHPTQGPLPKLPQYMSLFLTDPMITNVLLQPDNKTQRKMTYSPNKTASLPDLSNGIVSDDESDEDFNNLLRGPTHRPSTPSSFNIQKMFTSTPGPLKSGGTPQIPVKQPTAACSHSIPNYKGIVEKEVQMKERLLSNRYNEERLKLQRRHDEVLQKILDKKTKEVEEFRTEYRNKVLQLERRLHQALEETVRVREIKERQAFDFKNNQEKSAEKMQNDFEMRLSREKKAHEEEQVSVQQEHQAGLQKLIDETTSTMTKMEEEYKGQMDSMETFVAECEKKNVDLRSSLDEVQEKQRKESDRSQQLEGELAGVVAQLTQSDSRFKELEREFKGIQSRLLEDLEKERTGAAVAAELAQQELKHAQEKAQEFQKAMEQHSSEHQQGTEDLRRQHENNIWDLENAHKSEIAKLERQNDKRMRVAEKTADKNLVDVTDEVAELKKCLKKKEQEVEVLYESQKIENEKSDIALQDLKNEMQYNTDRLYKSVQEQVLILEDDLEKATFEREKLEVEFKKMLADERLKFDENIAGLQIQNEREKQHTIEKHHEYIACMERKYDEDKLQLQEEKSVEIEEAERKYKTRIASEIGKWQDLKANVDNLTVELNEAKSCHKKTVNEANAIREREKKHNQLAGEKLGAAHRAEKEELQKKNAKELEKLTKKTDAKIKLIENELDERLQSNVKSLEKFRAEAVFYQEENKRQVLTYERTIQKLHQEIEISRADEEHNHRNIVKALELEVETQRNVIRHLEKQKDMLALEMDEKITRTKLVFEEKMKGFVPSSVREELEETISALKAQSCILEQKAVMLQAELVHRSNRGSPYVKAKG